jgi:hypothetical protein
VVGFRGCYLGSAVVSAAVSLAVVVLEDGEGPE